jgi:hypothetical protein
MAMGPKRHENNDLMHLHVRVDGEADLNAICYALRGLSDAATINRH